MHSEGKGKIISHNIKQEFCSVIQTRLPLLKSFLDKTFVWVRSKCSNMIDLTWTLTFCCYRGWNKAVLWPSLYSVSCSIWPQGGSEYPPWAPSQRETVSAVRQSRETCTSVVKVLSICVLFYYISARNVLKLSNFYSKKNIFLFRFQWQVRQLSHIFQFGWEWSFYQQLCN